MNTNTPQGMSTLQDKRTGAGMYWSAAESARRCGVSRATIDRAIKAGKLAAEKDDEGAWRISPHALAEAGLNPGKPSPPEDQQRAARGGAMDRDEVHELQLAVLRAEVREQRTRADGLERERDLYRLMLEQGKQPQAPLDSPQTDEQPEPIPEPTTNPVGPSTGRPPTLREYARARFNVWRYR